MTDSSISTIEPDSLVGTSYKPIGRTSKYAERYSRRTSITTTANHGRIGHQIAPKVEKEVATVYHDVQVSAPSSFYAPIPAASGYSNDSLVNSFPQSSAGVLPSLTTGASSLNLRFKDLSHILTLLQR